MQQSAARDDFDTPWKEMLEACFEDFMAFFFPQAHAEIDWARGYLSLDHELQKIAREAELGRRLADKLVQVWRLGGGEHWVLIHSEIQSQPERDFAERMFVTNYRCYDRHRKPVVSLAVLGDESPGWRPERFGWEVWGCRMELLFPVVKLRDYNDSWAELEASPNPFATVVMAHLETRATRGDAEARLHSKTRLVRRLYERGLSREEVLRLFRFIDWIMGLPEELKHQFLESHTRFEEELKMPYVTTVERIGIEKGFKEGLEVGTEHGLRQGEALVVQRQLAHRFSELPAWAEERLRRASREEVERWAERVLDAGSLEEVFQM